MKRKIVYLKAYKYITLTSFWGFSLPQFFSLLIILLLLCVSLVMADQGERENTTESVTIIICTCMGNCSLSPLT